MKIHKARSEIKKKKCIETVVRVSSLWSLLRSVRFISVYFISPIDSKRHIIVLIEIAQDIAENCTRAIVYNLKN